MATIVQEVRYLSGSTSAVTTDDAVLGFVNDGSKHLFVSLPKELLWYDTDYKTVTSSTGIDVGALKVLSVYRGDVPCVKVDDRLVYSFSTQLSTTSLFDATSLFPKYFIRDNNIYIKPDPTAGRNGRVDYLVAPTLTSTDTSATISVPEMSNAIKYHAAGLDLLAMANYYTNEALGLIQSNSSAINTALTNFEGELPTWSDQTLTALSLTIVTSALSEAQKLINGNLPSATTDTVAWITDEDTEMAMATINAARQEVERASVELNKETVNLKEYELDIQNEVAKNKAAIDNAMTYLREAETRIADFQKLSLYNSNIKQYQESANAMLTLANQEIAYLMRSVGINTEGDQQR